MSKRNIGKHCPLDIISKSGSVSVINAEKPLVEPRPVTQMTRFSAVMGTLVVVGVTLALFASGKIRASKRATKIFLVAMIGYAVFSLVNMGLMIFGITDDAFGLRSTPSFVFGIPWGVLIGVLVILMAAYSLVLDFDSVQTGVKRGAPAKYGWTAAFGIMVTVIWLYLEILRLLAILRGNN